MYGVCVAVCVWWELWGVCGVGMVCVLKCVYGGCVCVVGVMGCVVGVWCAVCVR